MEVDDLVDAALVGFDRREAVTIPPLPDAASWEAFEAARHAMLPGFRNPLPAAPRPRLSGRAVRFADRTAFSQRASPARALVQAGGGRMV